MRTTYCRHGLDQITPDSVTRRTIKKTISSVGTTRTRVMIDNLGSTEILKVRFESTYWNTGWESGRRKMDLLVLR